MKSQKKRVLYFCLYVSAVIRGKYGTPLWNKTSDFTGLRVNTEKINNHIPGCHIMNININMIKNKNLKAWGLADSNILPIFTHSMSFCIDKLTIEYAIRHMSIKRTSDKNFFIVNLGWEAGGSGFDAAEKKIIFFFTLPKYTRRIRRTRYWFGVA